MTQDMLVLIGLGLFMKVFFDTAKQIKDKSNSKNSRGKIASICIHIGVGVLFIVIARVYMTS